MNEAPSHVDADGLIPPGELSTKHPPASCRYRGTNKTIDLADTLPAGLEHVPDEPLFEVELPLGGWLCLWDDGRVGVIDDETGEWWEIAAAAA